MHHFEYRDGALFAEDVDVTALAGKVGTPFYVYSAATLRRHVRVMREAFEGIETLVAYAMKANSNQAVLKLVGKEGAGADVVSGGELERALAAGIPASRIVFSGVGKTVAEMKRALEVGIKCFNLESEPELERLSEIAQSVGKVAPVAVRMSMPARTPRFRPARRKTSSAFPMLGRVRCMRGSRRCRGSRRSASTCISAARSPT